MSEPDLDVAPDVFATHGPFLLSPTGATPIGEPSYDEWAAAVTWAQNVERASPFWIGDLMLFGDRYDDMIHLTGLDYSTLANRKSVAKAVPFYRRRANLSFSHHAEVASLPADQQVRWLDKAEDELLTVQQLRVRIKAEKSEAAGGAIELWVVVRCSDAADPIALANELRARGHVVKLEKKSL